jgi:hypothetical protein
MGIYSNGHVYGVSLLLKDTTIFNRVYDQRVNEDGFNEVRNIYDAISSEDKEGLSIQIYTLCSSTYGASPFMTWFPIDRLTFETLLANN